ncbi:hypothetical protein Q9Q94_05090 [Uliginosibacterium sp. 31-16]|uniref:hypothetical protein n=1 Tax=Uliginosibacterium sp. 31-16 TaxID=3068315 RepID=UPI00273D7252|nr:hypothetical protein [Uliginosibacterium sp. 31-16]MDP5238892.1 hypothetical protein [Uliginosibacterium sp. 31-16]
MNTTPSNDLQPAVPESKARSGFRLASRVAKHLGIFLLVLILPPIWYDFFSGTQLAQHNLVLMAGAITWPLYVLWLSLKCPWPRLRFILLQLLGVLTLIGVAALLASCRAPDWLMWAVLLLPLVAAVLPLPALRRAERQQAGFRRNWLFGSLSSLPLALGFGILMFYATAMCAMAGMRW